MTHLNQMFSFLFVFSLCLSGGCGQAYRTPGSRADFDVLADLDIQAVLERKPASPLPVNLVAVRIQGPGYYSYTASGYGDGRFSVVTVRDVETDEDFERIQSLPDVSQIIPLSRLLLSPKLESDRPLRQAAAALHADMLLIYTFGTDFTVGDALKPLTVLSLGLSPNKQVRVTTTVSAILMDVRTGYIYGSCEETATQRQLASAWTSRDAVDSSRLKTERQAFEGMLKGFEKLWVGVASQLRNKQ